MVNVLFYFLPSQINYQHTTRLPLGKYHRKFKKRDPRWGDSSVS